MISQSGQPQSSRICPHRAAETHLGLCSTGESALTGRRKPISACAARANRPSPGGGNPSRLVQHGRIGRHSLMRWLSAGAQPVRSGAASQFVWVQASRDLLNDCQRYIFDVSKSYGDSQDVTDSTESVARFCKEQQRCDTTKSAVWAAVPAGGSRPTIANGAAGMVMTARGTAAAAAAAPGPGRTSAAL
jgi:hypothetical protein